MEVGGLFLQHCSWVEQDVGNDEMSAQSDDVQSELWGTKLGGFAEGVSDVIFWFAQHASSVNDVGERVELGFVVTQFSWVLSEALDEKREDWTRAREQPVSTNAMFLAIA